MPGITTEETFETAISQSLIKGGKYTEGQALEYQPDVGLFAKYVLDFLQESQPKNWDKLAAIHGNKVNERVIQRLVKEMDLRGSLDVIRNGFVDYGVRFKLAYFKPASGLNPQAKMDYEQNQLKVIRQVYYSKVNRNSIDLVISLNGIPVATLELKNQFTGQTAENAKKQYGFTRDNRELLFAFKKRAFVHFAVDPDEVYMTTRISGVKTRWLPFNKGYNHGKGNPPNPKGYRSSYLWEDALTKDSLLEIVQRFIHIQTEEYEYKGKTTKKEIMIFPRYHQLDCVRSIANDALQSGVGKNYLVQHSAGSGKSNSIAWLAYRLSSLHSEQNERVYDSVIVLRRRKIIV